MSISREEIFGPVLTAMTFDTPEEAVRIANDTAYGLSASVWSENIGKAVKTIRGIRAGRCWINNVLDGAPELPIGGYKQSGNGRETGKYGFDEYSEFKTILVSLGNPKPWYR
jgi:acyl-CoA reductase-like NAD-dependent aldehyde dehydrogenase